MTNKIVQYRTKPERVSFIHVLIEHEPGGSAPLMDLPAFQAFTAGVGERCEIPPAVPDAAVVGGYR